MNFGLSSRAVPTHAAAGNGAIMTTLRIIPASLLISTAVFSTGCEQLGALFTPGVTVIVENATAFRAVADIETSDSRNFVEDVFASPDAVGSSTVIGPNQTMTLRFDCDGELERITFAGAKFQDAGGFSLGDADADEAWRRDVDFDCGDTIRIRLSGTVFFFQASTSVESTGGGLPNGGPGSDSDDDIGDLIDQLLGS